MNIGIVTVWDERGAGYVSKSYFDYLKHHFKVHVFARGYSKNNFALTEEIYISKRVSSIKPMSIDKVEFKKWILLNNIETIIFNEQQSWEPILWCKEWGLKTIAYIDYYTEETIDLHNAYDLLLCNTKRHLEAFKNHHNAVYYKWGTDLSLFIPVKKNNLTPVFLHSCGFSPDRKGTEIVLRSFINLKLEFKLIIHTQIKLDDFLDYHNLNIERLIRENKLEIVEKTISAPGLYHLADFYLYPTKLEGIGLTILESISSGLLPVIPNHPPMNEFVPSNYQYKVDVNKQFSRSDGYYWPQIEVSQTHFNKIIVNLIKRHIEGISSNLRPWAEENFNLKANFKGLENLISNLNFKDIDSNTKIKILSFEKKRPINHKKIVYYLNPLINTSYKLFKILKWI